MEPGQEFDKCCEKALHLVDLGRFAEALTELEMALALEPENGWALSLASCCQRRLERYREAEQTARRALAVSPDFYPAHRTFLLALCEQKKYGQRIVDAVDNMLEKCHGEAGAYFTASGVYLELHWYEEALPVTERGLEVDPGHLGCLYVRAEALFKLHRFSEAKACLRRILKLSPENVPAYTRLGWEEYDAGHLVEAEKLFLKALECRPDSTSALKGLKRTRNLL